MFATQLIFGKSKRKKREFFIPYIKDREVIDIGCAGNDENPYEKEEWLHKYIAQSAKYCVGIDMDEPKVNAMKAMGYNAVAIKAQQIRLDRQFDVVCAFDVMEHIEDQKSFFDNINTLLKADGKLLISVPNPFFFWKFLRAGIRGDGNNNPEHVCWFCNSTIREHLRRYGFKVDRLEFRSGEPGLYRLIFLPKIWRHTSLYLVASRIG
ncbi:MAG: class I SAM-dependent methyltransferase [Bacteroidetes bacterium]|nr:class I SAM-dependent methyltransferase [Bacteroidota bacterium]